MADLPDLKRELSVLAILLVIGLVVGALLSSLDVLPLPPFITTGLAVFGLLYFLVIPAAAYGRLIRLRDQMERVRRQVLQTERELQAMVNIRPLAGDVPLPFGSWAMDAMLGEILARQIAEQRPRLVLECGSGTSTVFIASCLARWCPGARVISLDHQSEFAAKTRTLLQTSGHENRGTVVTAPLREHRVGEESFQWYDVPPNILTKQSVDLLIVDGPPGSTGPQARYPALPVLQDYLSDEAVIIMDDGRRPDEHGIATRWASTLGADLAFENEGKGTWILSNFERDAETHNGLLQADPSR